MEDKPFLEMGVYIYPFICVCMCVLMLFGPCAEVPTLPLFQLNHPEDYEAGLNATRGQSLLIQSFQFSRYMG